MIREKDILTYKNIEEFCSFLINLADEDLTNVIANRKLILELMNYVMINNDIVLKCCDIDFPSEYDKEYCLSLFYEDGELCFVIERAYNDEKDMYFGMDGYVLIHKEVCDEALSDILDNPHSEVSDYEWFVIGDADNHKIIPKTISKNEDKKDELTYDLFILWV